MTKSDTITYYYNKKILIDGVYVDNGTNTKNITNNDQYSGYSTFLGSLLTGGFDKNLIFNYFGYKTPPGFELPAYFTEVLNIVKDDDNFLTCSKTYKDSGAGADNITTVPFNIFVITGASGIFEGYKFVKITYFTDFTRTVEIVADNMNILDSN